MGHQQHTQAPPECVCRILSVPVGSRRLFFYPSPLPQTFSPKRLGYVSVLGGIRKHIATFSEIPDVMPTLDNITYYKIARCRSYSHILGTLIWGRCECRVRSLLAVVRSQRLCSPTFCPFRYRIPGCLAKVPSAFVGGTPLICPLRHRHKFHFLIW